MRISITSALLVMLMLHSCGKPELNGTFLLSPVSKIVVSKNQNQKSHLEHFFFSGNDSISLFEVPLLEYKTEQNRSFFKNRLYSASIQLLNDSIGIYEFSKLAGEIDEVYFVSKDSSGVPYPFIESHCASVEELKSGFDVDEDFRGLVFLVFEQAEEHKVRLGEHLVVYTTLKLDLEMVLCKKYRLKRNGQFLNLSWDEYRGIEDPHFSDNDGFIWGLNQGPYSDVLNKTGTSGEVLVFDLRSSRR